MYDRNYCLLSIYIDNELFQIPQSHEKYPNIKKVIILILKVLLYLLPLSDKTNPAQMKKNKCIPQLKSYPVHFCLLQFKHIEAS